MSNTELNVPLFQMVHESITAYPERHNQKYWEDQGGACGTTRCIAGWAISLTVDAPLYERGTIRYSSAVKNLLRDLQMSDYTMEGALGARLLGLNTEERGLLFYAGHDDARDAVRRLAEGGEGARTDVFASLRRIRTGQEGE